MRIVGYMHSDGYCLCANCEDGTTIDLGNDTGVMYPMFEIDEWEYHPRCDNCLEKIDVTLITEY
jgi:hypothetical protein